MITAFKTTKRNLLFLLIVCALFSSQAICQDLIPALLDQGLKLYAAKDYRGAADYLGQVIDMSEEHDQARYYLIYSLSLSGSRQKALEHAIILSKRQPAESGYSKIVEQLRNEIAAELAKKQEKRQAQTIAKDGIVGGYQTKDIVQKPRVSTQTYDITPPKPKTDLEKAIEKMDEEDYEQAKKMLEDLVARKTDADKALHYLGVINFNQGNYKAAIDDFNKAVKIDSGNFQSYFLLGDCFRALDDLKQAEANLLKALKIKEDVFAMLNLANVMTQQGRIKEAEEMYNKILKKDPDISDANVGLAQIQLSRGFSQRAAEMINETIAKGHGNPEAYYTKAKILMEDQLHDDAAEEVKRALEVFPGNLKYQSLYALSLVRGYKVQQGMTEAEKILIEFPDNIEARIVLAEALISSGALGDAEEHLERIESKIKHPQVSRLKAKMATRNGETEKIMMYMREYIERAAGLPGPSLEFALLLEAQNQPGQALSAFYEIAEAFPGTTYAEKAQERIEQLEMVKREKQEEERIEKSGLRPGKVKF